MEVGGEGDYTYLSLHCHHQNDCCLKMGSDESHFNVSVGSDGQSHKTVFTNHNLFEEKGEPKRYQTDVLPLTSLTPYRGAKPAHESTMWENAGKEPALDDSTLRNLLFFDPVSVRLKLKEYLIIILKTGELNRRCKWAWFKHKGITIYDETPGIVNITFKQQSVLQFKLSLFLF